MAPRSRLPLSPSMEARLSTSQDSLSSSGSNRELKTQLDSTLAEVEAIAEHLEKQKKPSLVATKSNNNDDILPKPTVRRKTSEQLSSRTLPSSNGARPRERASLSNITTTPPDPVPRPPALSTSDVSTAKEPLVNVKQSSWASREGLNSEQKAFSLNKNMWERRSGSTSGTDEVGSLRGGFRSNRDFWNQRVAIQQKQKQTPDLVLDLPASTAPAIKPKPRPRGSNNNGKGASDSLSSASSSSGDETLANSADQFAKPDRNTLRKSSGASTKSSPEEQEASEAVSTPKRIPPVQARLQQKRSTEH